MRGASYSDVCARIPYFCVQIEREKDHPHIRNIQNTHFELVRSPNGCMHSTQAAAAQTHTIHFVFVESNRFTKWYIFSAYLEKRQLVRISMLFNEFNELDGNFRFVDFGMYLCICIVFHIFIYIYRCVLVALFLYVCLLCMYRLAIELLGADTI